MKEKFILGALTNGPPKVLYILKRYWQKCVSNPIKAENSRLAATLHATSSHTASRTDKWRHGRSRRLGRREAVATASRTDVFGVEGDGPSIPVPFWGF